MFSSVLLIFIPSTISTKELHGSTTFIDEIAKRGSNGALIHDGDVLEELAARTAEWKKGTVYKGTVKDLLALGELPKSKLFFISVEEEADLPSLPLAAAKLGEGIHTTVIHALPPAQTARLPPNRFWAEHGYTAPRTMAGHVAQYGEGITRLDDETVFGTGRGSLVEISVGGVLAELQYLVGELAKYGA
ncbi:hypothetical protein J8273_3697 [Carpediemonas membranifera]|uniref:Uncharacterized protein n=1 Tax=Carpediemonas membranifera TaxID=201153 RepID=A0A8J6B7H8_9EUKA|nr:hypothetical protein J8273_3697 [Carpediemonas membranifera]|eukprot:KAG9394724.1 hypothetical protein J8273_3697 [Carpediemonas membranifera]